MHGETDLKALLAGLKPVLNPGTFVFCSVAGDTVPAGVGAPLFTFREAEGLTFVLTAARAQAAGLEATYPAAWITLKVSSALEAVGLLAAVTAMLADHGMSCNAVSAFHHDHLFVPVDRGEEAIALLTQLWTQHRDDAERP